MRRDARVTLIAVLLACGIALAASSPLPLPAREPIPAADPGLESALLAATNAARARFGKPALSQGEGLARAAREHASEMAQLDYFSHGSPVPAHATLEKRLALAGSPLVDVAENIVLLGSSKGDRADAEQAVQDWLNSPHHRKNLLNGTYDRVGFGAARNAQGQLFIVQDFAAQPVTLLADDLAPAARSVTELAVQVRSSRALTALFDLSGAAQTKHALPAGASSVTLTTGASGTAELVVGVPNGGNSYLIDDGGSIDLASGSYHPDPGQPRETVTITGVTVRRHAEHGARLTLAYAAPAGTRMDLFLQGSQQPGARTSPGHFQLFLPASLGVATISVGVDQGGGKVSIVHHFHVDPSAAAPRLLAGPGPGQ